MILSAADQLAMINTIGEIVTITTTVDTVQTVTPFLADFRTQSAPVTMFDGSVMSSTPTARITETSYAAYGIQIGSIITARSIEYQVAEIRQEQSGFYHLTLVRNQ